MSNATRDLLEQHFDTAFAAPDGIKKLRELILTLAMQGKLVPQDADDPPASHLLKSIDAEKKRLVKEGKIRASKPSLPVSAEEMPYALPQGWEWIRLSRLGYFLGGKTPSTNDESLWGGAIPWVSPKDMKVSQIRSAEDTVSELGLHSGLSLVPRNSILMVVRSGILRRTFPVAINEVECTINQDLKALVPFHLEQAGFLLLMFRGLESYILSRFTKKGVTVESVVFDAFSDAAFPLPPLAEQHRIVAKIDQLMARCDELERLRAEREQKRRSVHTAALKQLLDAQAADSIADAWRFISQHFGDLYAVKEDVAELRKAVLQLAVMGRLSERDDDDESVTNLLAKVKAERHRLKIQEPLGSMQESEALGYKIPKSWEWRCLGDLLVSGPTNGFSPRAVDYETQVRSLTLSATTSGVFKGEHSKFIADNIPSDSDLWLRDGDILVQRGNTLEYVGVSAVYRGEPSRYIYPDLMMKLRVSSELDTDYVYFAMSSEAGRDFLRARASGTSGTMPKINQKTLKSLPVPIPPVAEQRRIVAKINRLMDLCCALDAQIDAAPDKQTELLNALMASV